MAPNHKSSMDRESWLPALADFLLARADLGAMRVDPAGGKISIATLGVIDEEELRTTLHVTLRAAEKTLMPEKPLNPALTVESSPEGTLLSKPSCLTEPALWSWREFEWPEREPEMAASCCSHDHDWKTLLLLASICGGAALAGWVVESLAPGQIIWSRSLYLAAFIAGGWDAAIDAFAHIKKGKLDIHFLMLAVAVGAITIGAWSEGALLLFLFSFSGALEHYALYRTRKEVDALFKAAPREATLLLPDGSEQTIPVGNVKPGDRLAIRPGDLFPVDALLLTGQTAADESNLTGESLPVEKTTGDALYSGTLNLWGAVEATALRPVGESALQKVLRLIEEAQNQKAPSQSFTDRFGTRYTVIILSLTTVMFFVWWLAFDLPAFINEAGVKSAFYQAMTLLVVASPCALVLSIPSAILAAIAWGARRGILFRGGAAIENLADIDIVALDKTGTLTTGEMVVDKIESFPPGRENEAARYAYSLERHSDHPIARAIVKYGKKENLPSLPVKGATAFPGMGMEGLIDGSKCILGRRELLCDGPLAEFAEKVPPPALHFIEVWIIAGDFLGRILLRDQVRPQSKPFLKELARRNLKTVMLTGDRRETAEAVAHELGLQEVRSGLTPSQKVDAIHEFKKSGLRVAMVGDGLNDAPSLTSADVAVAMGSRGSDAALERSDVILMQDRIESFVDAYRLSLASRKVIRQNITIALGTVVVMVGATLIGVLPLSMGVLAHEGSTVLVCFNSLRLLFIKDTVSRHQSK